MLWLILLLPVAILAVTLWHHRCKQLPPGTHYLSPWRRARDCRFIYDHSYTDQYGKSRQQRHIIAHMLGLIAGARKRLLLELFLYNDDLPRNPEHVPVTETFTRALLARKAACPELHITLLVDPVNSLYGAFWPEHFKRLESAGIEIDETPLTRLRDSNPAWSVWWRLLIAPWGNRRNRGWLPNPTGTEKITLRSWLAVLNFKADHRKLLVADHNGEWVGMVSSANVHDASSCHTNVALRFGGDTATDLYRLLETNRAVCRGDTPPPLPTANSYRPETREPQLRLITEGQIRNAALELLCEAQAGDRLDLGLFYFSHRALLRAAIQAQARGVTLRVLLDPNKDAFGHVKGGVPNRQSAWELHRHGVTVRWYRTRGEQFHAKFMLLERQNGMSDLLLGSANYTRRNLDDLNMESSVQLHGPATTPSLKIARGWFERCWFNPTGYQCSVPYETWADHRILRYLFYRVIEGSGWCSF